MHSQEYRSVLGVIHKPMYEFTPIPGSHVPVCFDLSEPAKCLLGPLLHSSDVRHGLTDERKPQFQRWPSHYRAPHNCWSQAFRGSYRASFEGAHGRGPRTTVTS